jgi:hypothetical protein
MGITFTGFVFDTDIENGGDGLKIGFFRCQAARIAKKRCLRAAERKLVSYGIMDQ